MSRPQATDAIFESTMERTFAQTPKIRANLVLALDTPSWMVEYSLSKLDVCQKKKVRLVMLNWRCFNWSSRRAISCSCYRTARLKKIFADCTKWDIESYARRPASQWNSQTSGLLEA